MIQNLKNHGIYSPMSSSNNVQKYCSVAQKNVVCRRVWIIYIPADNLRAN